MLSSLGSDRGFLIRMSYCAGQNPASRLLELRSSALRDSEARRSDSFPGTPFKESLASKNICTPHSHTLAAEPCKGRWSNMLIQGYRLPNLKESNPAMGTSFRRLKLPIPSLFSNLCEDSQL